VNPSETEAPETDEYRAALGVAALVLIDGLGPIHRLMHSPMEPSDVT
jgi:hypothetical protein